MSKIKTTLNKNKTHTLNKNKTHTLNKNKTHTLNKSKKNILNKNKKTLKQTYLGGKPKINFPYVYLQITYDDLKNFELLNWYISYKNCCCNKISSGTITDCVTNRDMIPTPTKLVLSDNTHYLVLVIKYNQFVNLYKNANLLLDNNFLQNEILGHAIIKISSETTGVTVAAIYDVCSHHPEKVGYGKIIFNSILQYIKDKNSITYCWLGIKMSNINFDKVANIYISSGFGKGFFTFVDPWNQQLNFPFISLIKKTIVDVVNEESTYVELLKTIQIKNQLSNCIQTNTNYSTFMFKFDKTTIINLRILPFSSHTQITDSLFKRQIELISENSWTSDLRELSGIFNIYNAYKNDKLNSIYKLSLVTIDEDSSIQYTKSPNNTATELNIFKVLIPNESYTFHTHPIQAYYQNKVILGTPSGTDYTAYFYKLMLPFNNPNITSYITPQFHMVVSIEGIYILSLSKESINNIDKIISGKDIISGFLNTNYEYPMEERFYDWVDDNTSFDDSLNTHITKFFEWFNKINVIHIDNMGTQIPFFDLTFKPWKELDTNTIFTVTCPLILQNPFVKSSDCLSIFKTFPNAKFNYSTLSDITMLKNEIDSMSQLDTSC